MSPKQYIFAYFYGCYVNKPPIFMGTLNLNLCFSCNIYIISDRSNVKMELLYSKNAILYIK